ncbi:MAG: type II secretion system protein [Bacteriovorax sp.]|nr:type II secretion system protein [Bacteriovorax sp.]
MLFKNNRGFSLVEIMIVVAMLGGISLVVMNLTKQSTKSSVKYQFDTEINLITSEINAILSNPTTCLATFQANALTPNNINGKYYTVASGSAPAGGYGNAKVQITSYSLAHSTLPSATVNDGILTILFQNKTMVGGTTTSRTINIYYEGPITAITSCRSLSTSTTDIW